MKSTQKNSASRISQVTLSTVVALVLSACGAPGPSPDGGSPQRDASPKVPSAEDFPPLESAKWTEGGSPTVETLRQIGTGMGKDSVRQLLGWPHFNEGFAGVREWNYVFHIPKGKSERMTCQYMLRFDERMLSTGAYWKDSGCEILVTRVKPIITPAPEPPMQAMPPQKLILSVDQSFSSGVAGSIEMSPAGLKTIQLLAAEIRRRFRLVHSITVTGYTDRSESDAISDSRSLAWATAVRDALVQQAMDPDVVRASGAGKEHPLVECGTLRGRVLSTCLRPNRRIEIEVAGAR